MADIKFKNVKTFMNDKNLHFSFKWLKECVEYYLENEPGIQDYELCSNVKDQWLLSDLREARVPVLPANLKDTLKMELPGRYVVQVETMLDSGKSRYMQLQDLRKNRLWENVRATTLKNEENDISEKRCLTMTITDGVQTLQAMEYEVIPELRLNDPDQLPGFKMLIIGPVTCRHGMIMLSRRSVEVLGGEVSSLVQSNSYEALLIGVLGIDVQPRSIHDQHVLNQDVQQAQNTGARHNMNIQKLDSGQNMNSRIMQSQHNHQPMDIQNHPNADTMFDDDDDILMEVPLDGSTTHDNDVIDEYNTDNMFDDDFDVPESVFHDPTTSSHPPPAMKRAKAGGKLNFPTSGVTPPTNSITTTTTNVLDNIKSPEPEVLYETPSVPKSTVQSSLSRYLLPCEQESTNQRSLETINEEPFIYLEQICSLDLKCDRMFRVKAHILTIRGKIQIKDENLVLVAAICDGSLTIDVNFSSDVLEQILGYSPDEVTEMMKKRKQNPAMDLKFKRAFASASHKLISLNCIFCVKFFQNKSMPLVIDLEEVSALHLRQLAARKH